MPLTQFADTSHESNINLSDSGTSAAGWGVLKFRLYRCKKYNTFSVMAFDLFSDMHLKFHQLKEREKSDTHTQLVKKAQPISCSRFISMHGST